ncbi:major facilitator superfamily transporter [Xylariaceae sp. FL0594]|nr:major facilitator superfamily transporter [Xylariaceae sp. FL0594]
MSSSSNAHETTSLLAPKQNGDESVHDTVQFSRADEQPLNSLRARNPDTVDVEANETTAYLDDVTGAPKPALSTSRLIQIIAVLMIGLFTSNLDTSLVFATHPRIASEFNALEDSSWIFVSFLLAGLMTQVLYAKLSDVYGRRVVIVFCYGLFATGCALIGMSRSMGHVVLGRILSGSGGSGMSSLVLVITTDLIPLRQVATWFGYINIVSTTGRSLGGPIGGFLADRVGWRWSFLGQAPLFLTAMIACILVVPNTKPASPKVAADDSKGPKNWLSRIDFAGTLLLGAAVLFLMFPLEIGGVKVPWTHPLVFGLFAMGVLALVLFIVNESRWAEEPAIPLRLLKHRDILASYLAMCCIAGAQTTLMYFVPMYFQVTAGVSNTVAGLHLIPAVAGNAVGGLVAGQVIRRTGGYKYTIIGASISATVAYTLLVIRWRGHTNWWESLYIAPGGFGSGMASSAVFVCLNAVVEPAHKAVVVSGLQLTFPIGMLLGVTASSAAMFGLLPSTLEKKLLEIGLPPETRSEIIKKAIGDVGYIRQLPASLRDIVVSSYVGGFRAAFSVILTLSLIGLLAGSLIRNRRI